METDSAGRVVAVEDLDASDLLALVEDSELQARAAERRKLRLAVQWCALHPAEHADDRDRDVRIGGDGTPDVAAFTAEPFGTALGVSTHAATQLLSDALDLVHRLPRAWAQVEALALAPWRARRLAQATSTLSREAAAYVDARLARVLDSCGPTRIERVVDEARARFDAAAQAEEEDEQRAEWGVRLRHGPSGRFAGTSWLEVTGDTPTLTRLHDLICATAQELRDPDDPTTADLDSARSGPSGWWSTALSPRPGPHPLLRAPGSTSTSTRQRCPPTPPWATPRVSVRSPRASSGSGSKARG